MDITKGLQIVPPSSPEETPIMLSMDIPEVELTLLEAIQRVKNIQGSIEDIRRQRNEEASRRAKHVTEAEDVEAWRQKLLDDANAESDDLDKTISQLNLEVYQLTEKRNKKILLHKQERERLKREAEYIDMAGARMLAFEMRLTQAMAQDAKRLASRIKQVHEATKTDLKNKMEALIEMGDRQHAKNSALISKLQAEVLAQRAVFWEGQKLRKYGQESTFIVAMPTNADKDAQRAIQHIKSGDTLLRFNEKTGKSEECWVQVDTSCNFVNWQNLSQNRSGFGRFQAQAGRIDLMNEAVDVIFGAKSPVFYFDDNRPPIKGWLCFTVITRDRHTHDFMAPDQDSAAAWFMGLQTLIPSNFKIDGSVRNRNVGRGYILWRRGMMKIQHSAMGVNMTVLSYLAERLLADALDKGLADETVVTRVQKKRPLPSPARSTSASVSHQPTHQVTVEAQTPTQSNQRPISQTVPVIQTELADGSDEAHEAILLSARATRNLSMPVGQNGESSRQIVLLSPEQGLTTPGKPQTETMGVIALRLALQQGVLSRTDLLECSDDELREKIVTALEFNKALRDLFRKHLENTRGYFPSDSDSDEEAGTKETRAPQKNGKSKPSLFRGSSSKEELSKSNGKARTNGKRGAVA
eukprot:c15113_g1_i1.p1 GENE.c15113_g1_i1~~c15113_g1_i1.p1  ORF type:complete len:638 (-),score=146.47 c15113_g1_i1:412-2325(-)